uniref:Histidine-containing phosphotransfer protein n=1 Tax=Aegilops tauschii TaxID=37682 RepID=R7WA32_AEGTA
MSAAQIRAEINGLIASKFAELYVMWRYKKIRKGMVVEVMERFLQDADKILTEIAVLLLAPLSLIWNEPQLDYDKVEGIADQLEGCSSSRNQPVVDFDKVDALVQQLKGCSSR